MKECCKTGDETPEKNKLKRYFNLAIYAIVCGIIVWTVTTLIH